MTVKQLIAQLKKMPANAQVYTADHDHAEDEVNAPVGLVILKTRGEVHESACEEDEDEPVVVFHP